HVAMTTPPTLALHAPSPTRRSSDLRRAGPARRSDRKAQPAAVDRDPPSRNGDAAARDIDRRRKGDPGHSPALTDRAMGPHARLRDRKSTRLNSSHVAISYAVFCLKK